MFVMCAVDSPEFGLIPEQKREATEADLQRFEEIYMAFNRPEFIHPDPLEFVLRFKGPADQEVSGIVAATLAFGRVGHILKSLESVFGVLKSPASDIALMSNRELRGFFRSFRHRWATGEELADLLVGVKYLREKHGSLENCFKAGMGREDADVVPALTRFVGSLKGASGRERSSLLSCPTGGSACKRLLLYLRWMVRKDEVDPGPWKGVPPSKLMVPMDTHMYRIGRAMGLTSRKQADMRSSIEVTAYFRTLRPEDPVRYDFSLTRPGIRGEKDFFETLGDSRASLPVFC
jgi:uncharacterized protein (TIGR02757 family)